MEIKTGTAYSVKTGYKLYEDQTAYDAGTVANSQAGEALTMTFEAAGAYSLLAGALAITASLLA